MKLEKKPKIDKFLEKKNQFSSSGLSFFFGKCQNFLKLPSFLM